MKHNAMKAFLPFACAFILLSQSAPALAEHKTAASIPAAVLIQPTVLAASLKSSAASKPLILHVGFRKLYALGFTRVKALYIADNFGTDWVDKGYPVAQGG